MIDPLADLAAWSAEDERMDRHRELKRAPDGSSWVECLCGQRYAGWRGNDPVGVDDQIRDHISEMTGRHLASVFPYPNGPTTIRIKAGETLDWDSGEFSPGTGTVTIQSSEPGSQAPVLCSLQLLISHADGAKESMGGWSNEATQWRQNQVVVNLGQKTRRFRIQTSCPAAHDMSLAIMAPGAKPLAYVTPEVMRREIEGVKAELTSQLAAGLAKKEATRMTLEEFRNGDPRLTIERIAQRLTTSVSPKWNLTIHTAVKRTLIQAHAYAECPPTSTRFRSEVNALAVADGLLPIPYDDPLCVRFEALIAEELQWVPSMIPTAAPTSAIIPPAPIPSLPQEQAMPESPSHVPTPSALSQEFRAAAYQVAAGKLTEVAAQSLGSLLQRELADDSPEVRARIGKFLEGTMGELTVALLLSALVGPLGGPLADRLGLSSKQLDALSSALRVHAMVHGGTALLDTFLDPLMLVVKDALRGLPAEDIAPPRLLPEAQSRETVETTATKTKVG